MPDLLESNRGLNAANRIPLALYGIGSIYGNEKETQARLSPFWGYRD
jgi:hypothetical protein